MVITFFQILICQCFLNFLTFTPFCKAYCLKDQIYKKSLYRQIREGEHPCYVSIKKITQLIINMVQLFMIFSIFYSVNNSGISGNNDLLAKLDRIILLSCSDPYINQSLMEINVAFDYISSWFALVIIMVLFNIYIDYFGLYLSYGDTWRKLHAYVCMCKCFRVKNCCKKKSKEFQKITGE